MTLLGEYLARTREIPADFARRAQVPAPMVSEWCHGFRRPGLRNALKVEAATKGEVPARYWITVKTKTRKRRRRCRCEKCTAPAQAVNSQQ